MQVKRIKVQTIEVIGLGDKIREAKKKDPRSVTELSRLCDISRGYWYDLEKEKSNTVSEETIRKIETVLGVDFEIYFDE